MVVVLTLRQAAPLEEDLVDRIVAVELVPVPDAAALAASQRVGQGRKEDAESAAVDAMRSLLGTILMAASSSVKGRRMKDGCSTTANG